MTALCISLSFPEADLEKGFECMRVISENTDKVVRKGDRRKTSNKEHVTKPVTEVGI